MPIYNISNINQLSQITQDLQRLFPQAVIYLHGDLGVGKTTLVQQWLKNAKYQGIATSPTYQLVNEYQLAEKYVLHADLYRLSASEELIYLDVDEWKNRADWIFIEWPEKGGNLLPSADLHIHLTFNGKARYLDWHTDK